ncbi:MAG: molybdenum cofactor biosynthesis protein MoaE [Gammaproteobacteria bacterium]|nr:molybdenum cofactor biosynthesis protein MoaE [Gammaproteobacteria bacterium]
MRVTVRIQEQDFSLAREWNSLRQRIGGTAGGIVAFAGLVRDRARAGEEVSRLFLEHYPGMTESSIEEIIGRARERWPLQDVVVVHRVGDLEPGDQIVLVLAASAHRGAAFAGCEYVMDMLKTKAVFWKKEVQTGSEGTWIRSTGDDFERAKHWQDDR